jgi:hypothetical protein
MSEEVDKMSINVFTNNREEILKSDNSSTEYILKMNESLTNSIIDLRLKVQELRNKVDELETENDKQDSSMRYMRGMLNNFVELVELYKSVSNRKGDINKVNDKELEFYCGYSNRMFDAYYMTLILYIFSNIVGCYFEFVDISTICKGCCSIVICALVSFQYCELIDDHTFTDNPKLINAIVNGIEDDTKKIKEIESSSDFISDYIDCL